MPAWVTSPVHRSVVEGLISARKLAALTQRDLAARIGKPPSFVGKVEAIERNLSVTEFIAWCGALGVEPDAVLKASTRGLRGPVEI